jgi:signal transduction histidine kinase
MRFAITNGGCALSTEDIGRLGEPYFTTKIRGTGLGLALCRRIVEAHGGLLQFRADPDRQRLTVAFTLPRASRPGVAAPDFPGTFPPQGAPQ